MQYQASGVSNDDEMRTVLSGAFSSSGKIAGHAMHSNMSIMNDIPPDAAMSAAYWNASDGSRRDVRKMLHGASHNT